MLKQAIIVRTDLKMSIGKLVAQSCHASVEAVLKSKPEKLRSWRRFGAKKVVLAVDSLAKLKNIYQQANKAKLISVLISDAGLTELKPGTKTAVAIGPDDETKINKITGSLASL